MNQIQIDALKEIGGIAAGNAATAFSQMLGRKVGISVPTARIMSVEEIRSLSHQQDSKICVYRKILGSASGSILLAVPAQEAAHLVHLVTSRSAGSDLSREDRDLLVELGNIVSGAYLTTLSNITKIVFMATVPRLLTNEFEGIVNQSPTSVAPFAFVIYNELRVENSTLGLELVMFSDARTLEAILKAVGLPR